MTDVVRGPDGELMRVTQAWSNSMDLSWVKDGDRWKRTATEAKYDNEGRVRSRVTTETFAYEGELVAAKDTCSVFWGSHGCHRERGHEGDCWCDCCCCVHHPDADSGCVAGPPYYGDETSFFGDDVEARGLARPKDAAISSPVNLDLSEETR